VTEDDDAPRLMASRRQGEEERVDRTVSQVLRTAVSHKGFEVTLVLEPTPQSRHRHYGVYRRGLSAKPVFAGRAASGPGHARWTPALERAPEAIFALFLQDVTDAARLAPRAAPMPAAR
jgi:hypothetical protein